MKFDVSENSDHRYLDEAGDTSFYGKGKRVIVGQDGVSLSFSIGMLRLKGNQSNIRNQVVALQQEIAHDEYLNCIPSIEKKINRKGFYFHATDDPPEVRDKFYRYIKSLDASLEVFVARKDAEFYERYHKGNESNLYADILSHLIKSKLQQKGKLVLNIAERGNTTKNIVLQRALSKAKERASYKLGNNQMTRTVVFNVQNHHSEPLLNIADYLCWAVQRVFERGEMRYCNFLRDKIKLVVDLYDREKYEGFKNYYDNKKNPLTTENKLSPPCT